MFSAAMQTDVQLLVQVTGSVDESVKLWQEAGDTLEQRHHLVSCCGCLSC